MKIKDVMSADLLKYLSVQVGYGPDALIYLPTQYNFANLLQTHSSTMSCVLRPLGEHMSSDFPPAGMIEKMCRRINRLYFSVTNSLHG